MTKKETVPDVATLKNGGHVVPGKKTLLEMQYLHVHIYFSMEKAFQDCFGPYF